MIKNLLRITVLSYIWKRYKIIIVSTLCLFAYFWLVGKLHADFVGYSELNGDKEYLGLSFVIKWLAFLVGFLIYLALSTWYRTPEKNKHNNLSTPLNGGLESRKKLIEKSTEKSSEPNRPDPFDEIRKKGKLRSKSDLIIEKK